jgi:chromosome segregation ATPase
MDNRTIGLPTPPQQQPSREPTTGLGADIYNKIQVRAHILAQTQNEQTEAEEMLKEKQQELAIVTEKAREVRRVYLQKLIQLHSNELENDHMQEKIRKCKESTEQLKHQEEQILNKMNEEKSQWEHNIEGKLIEHRFRLELYQSHLLTAIQDGFTAIERRKQKIEDTSKLSEQLRREREVIVEKKKQVRSEIQSIAKEDDSTNQLIEELALSVRNSLTKVSR